jgi:hypothetical protein
MTDYLDELAETIDRAAPRLAGLTASEAGARRAPGAWSRLEILGHLIDSAANNHQRFVRARQAPLVFPGYDQEHWVRAQAYDQAEWKDLVTLWESYNRHLLHIMSATPEGARGTRCTIGAGEPVTLEFLMSDYVAHLRHHLRQILGEDAL